MNLFDVTVGNDDLINGLYIGLKLYSKLFFIYISCSTLIGPMYQCVCVHVADMFPSHFSHSCCLMLDLSPLQ